MADDPFPTWNKAATKGDVIQASIHVQSIVVKLIGVHVAESQENAAARSKAIAELFEASRNFSRFIDSLSGRAHG